MSRYTDSSYRKSRHLGFSILETGKELAKNHMDLVFMDKRKLKNYLNMVFNYKKNKKLDSCMD